MHLPSHLPGTYPKSKAAQVDTDYNQETKQHRSEIAEELKLHTRTWTRQIAED